MNINSAHWDTVNTKEINEICANCPLFFITLCHDQYGAARHVWQGGVWAVGPGSRWIQPHDIRLLEWSQVRITDVHRLTVVVFSGDVTWKTDGSNRIHRKLSESCLRGFLLFFLDQVRALPCPGYETVFSSLHPALSGGKRSCLDSICMVLILQTREQSQSWEEGTTILLECFIYILAITRNKLRTFQKKIPIERLLNWFSFIGTLRFCVSTGQNFSGMNILQSIISVTRGNNGIII